MDTLEKPQLLRRSPSPKKGLNFDAFLRMKEREEEIDADLDGDGALAISELYDKVRGQVQDWSDLGEGPTQNPVIDRDNLRARFALPLLPEDVRARFIEAR